MYRIALYCSYFLYVLQGAFFIFSSKAKKLERKNFRERHKELIYIHYHLPSNMKYVSDIRIADTFIVTVFNTDTYREEKYPVHKRKEIISEK